MFGCCCCCEEERSVAVAQLEIVKSEWPKSEDPKYEDPPQVEEPPPAPPPPAAPPPPSPAPPPPPPPPAPPPPPPPPEYEGMCSCGQVTIRAPKLIASQFACHCKDCIGHMGGALACLATWPSADVEIAGATTEYTGPNNLRISCAKCFGSVATKNPSTSTTSVGIALFRGEVPFEPTVHIAYESRKAAFCDGVQKFDAYPSTMGGSGMITAEIDQADAAKVDISSAEGKCPCGAITLKLKNAPQASVHCHCSDCAAYTGNVCSHVHLITKGDEEVTGEVNRYMNPSTNTERWTCKNCSAYLGYFKGDGSNVGGVTGSIFDQRFESSMEIHCRESLYRPARCGGLAYETLPEVFGGDGVQVPDDSSVSVEIDEATDILADLNTVDFGAMVIKVIQDDGALAGKVDVYSRIVEVNGIRGATPRLLEELKKGGAVEMRVQKPVITKYKLLQAQREGKPFGLQINATEAAAEGKSCSSRDSIMVKKVKEEGAIIDAGIPMKPLDRILSANGATTHILAELEQPGDLELDVLSWA